MRRVETIRGVALVLLLGLCASTAEAGLFDCLKRCKQRGSEGVQVAESIQVLMCSPRWRERDNAAHRLGDADWRRYPEVLPALLCALQRDRHEEVREEAAESLARLSPCTEEARAVLARASACDPDHATRKWARRALERMGRACVEPCRYCSAPLPTFEVVHTPGEDGYWPEPETVIVDGPGRAGPYGLPRGEVPAAPRGALPGPRPGEVPGIYPAPPLPYLPGDIVPAPEGPALELAPPVELPPVSPVPSPFLGRGARPAVRTASSVPARPGSPASRVVIWSTGRR